MKTNPSLVVVFFCIISCFINGSHCSMQGDALYKLFKAKFNGNRNIDTSLFEAMASKEIGEVDIKSDAGSKEADRIVSFPGQPPVKFTQYGGYVTTDKVAGRALYYYFVEAENSKESLPLLLWLNGGPGCSSLSYGAMQELGPFRVHSDGASLYSNTFAWNKVANVLFLESPAGVGFSYSNRTSDYNNSGDRSTATDNYVFLVKWLERFPEYKGRDFYISGESYAGHYVPQLAHKILQHNKKAGKNIINLKGIAIGNAVINDETDELGMYDYFGTHALTSPETVKTIRKYCNFSPDFKGNQTKECQTAADKADEDTENIDVYNIYAPLCHSLKLTPKPKRASLADIDPCSENYVRAYFNRPDVQEAIHANVTKLDHPWTLCSDVLSAWTDSSSTIIPLLQEFMSNGLRVWVYSGDVDGRVPFISTQYSIEKMNLTIKTPWYDWAQDQEVGGYVQVYKGDLTFVTVRGAGHEVPTYQPARALSLIGHFLTGQPLPKAVFDD